MRTLIQKYSNENSDTKVSEPVNKNKLKATNRNNGTEIGHKIRTTLDQNTQLPTLLNRPSAVLSQVNRPEWSKRKEAFVTLFSDIKTAFEKICSSPNRELVYNLYTYIWDMVVVVSMLLSYVDWLSLGQFSPQYKQLIVGR